MDALRENWTPSRFICYNVAALPDLNAVAQLLNPNSTMDTKIISLYIQILVRDQCDLCSLRFDVCTKEARITTILSETLFLDRNFNVNKQTLNQKANDMAETCSAYGCGRVSNNKYITKQFINIRTYKKRMILVILKSC